MLGHCGKELDHHQRHSGSRADESIHPRQLEVLHKPVREVGHGWLWIAAATTMEELGHVGYMSEIYFSVLYFSFQGPAAILPMGARVLTCSLVYLLAPYRQLLPFDCFSFNLYSCREHLHLPWRPLETSWPAWLGGVNILLQIWPSPQWNAHFP